jgi:transketolase
MPDRPDRATRDGYGKALVELGKQNDRVVVLDADLWTSTRTEFFREQFPDRFFDMGIAEQNMMGVAAGLALSGRIPFVSSFACFASRGWEQMRVSIALPHVNVKIVTTHAGLTVGEDGASAQMNEDLALLRVLPGMAVICPSDATETEKAVFAIAEYDGPVWMRLGRSKVPDRTPDNARFEVGKATLMRRGADVTIVACGIMVDAALRASDDLAYAGIEADVINMSTIKPLDTDALLASVLKTGAVVTAEEHQIEGGLGGAIAEALAAHQPAPVEFVGVKDAFGESGPPDELLTKYGLTSADIVSAAKRARDRRVRKSAPRKPAPA